MCIRNFIVNNLKFIEFTVVYADNSRNRYQMKTCMRYKSKLINSQKRQEIFIRWSIKREQGAGGRKTLPCGVF